MQGITQAHCNACGRSTNHDILGVDRQTYDDWSDVQTLYLYEMLKCCGYGSVRMRIIYMSTQDEINHEVYYPPAIARHPPPWVAGAPDSPKIPLPIRLLIKEVYIAAQNNLLRIAAMGIRAILENVMKEKVGDRTFKKLIDEFQKAGYVSTRQAGTLDSILEAGHAAIHRDWE